MLIHGHLEVPDQAVGDSWITQWPGLALCWGVWYSKRKDARLEVDKTEKVANWTFLASVGLGGAPILK